MRAVCEDLYCLESLNLPTAGVLPAVLVVVVAFFLSSLGR